MSLDEFVDKVSRSAMGTNNPVFTRQMAEHSLARVEELKAWGFFDSPLYYNSFNKPITARKIPVIERIMLTHLIKEKGRITGTAGFSMDEAKIHFFTAKSVILCTGAGGFKPSGFPICDLTHDGTVMAYHIGAKVTGKEWNDGHTGQATYAAACYDGWHGMFDRKPGVTGVDVHHDLGVELNYQAYKAVNPLAGGPPGHISGERIAGGPYRPAEFRENGRRPGPPPGGSDFGGAPASGDDGREPGRRIFRRDGNPQIRGTGSGQRHGRIQYSRTLRRRRCPRLLYGRRHLYYTQGGSSLAGSAVQGAKVSEAAAEYSKGVELPRISNARIKVIEEEILAPLKKDFQALLRIIKHIS